MSCARWPALLNNAMKRVANRIAPTRLSMEIILKFLMLWLLVSGAMMFLYARREIIANWHEPVLRRPVLIIESDDWGPGPASQAGVLADISRLLGMFFGF